MHYVLGSGGARYGPVDAAVLRDWARDGRLTPDMTLEPADGSPALRAGDLPELAGAWEPPPLDPKTRFSDPPQDWSTAPSTTNQATNLLAAGWTLFGVSFAISCCCFLPGMLSMAGAMVCGWVAATKGGKSGKVLAILAGICLILYMAATVIWVVMSASGGAFPGVRTGFPTP